MNVGAVLLVEEQRGLHQVMYGSCKLNHADKKYSAIEGVCLAHVWAIRTFARYFYGKSFVLQNDHQPLEYLSKFKDRRSRLLRWSFSLQEFIL